MDAWVNDTPAKFALSFGTTGPEPDNPLFARVLEAKEKLKSDSFNQSFEEGSEEAIKSKLFMAISEGDVVGTEAVLSTNPELLNKFYPENSNGFSPLIFAVVFRQNAILDSLLRVHSADPDAPDTTPTNYSPLMWAIAVKDVSIVSLLIEFEADPHLSPGNIETNASSLAASTTSTEIFEYFKSHNLFKKDTGNTDLFQLRTFGSSNDDTVDDVAFKIRMLTLAANNGADSLDDESSMDEESRLASDTLLAQVRDFDYEKTLPDQFIKFSDLDIPSLLDYIFGLRTTSPAYQHNTKIPAAILFQLMHYSHNKVESKDLTEFVFECFITRLRSVTNTKSGVFNMALATGDQIDKSPSNGAGDIVLLSYWLSSIQFLHFYFTKAKLYSAYPKFLQELLNLTQSLIATLSFSINSRLNVLADDCMLNFTSLVDASSVLYAKDWNIFKSQKKHPNSYDDILHMLYPPSLNDLMKPSPLKYVQVLGALHYVLELHSVDSLLRIQAFSQVFYYINATLFNRLISNSRYCSRVKAMQIRLNISALEDWLRSHNFRAHKPDRIGGLELLVSPENDTGNLNLSLLLAVDCKENDPNGLPFYYRSLYNVSKTQMLPSIELLQWIQVMTGIKDEEALINTVNEFETLNYYQLVKLTSKLYRYEVNEKKFPKSLIQILKRLMSEQGESQISRSQMHYMTQSTFLLKEVYIYLNPNYIFGVALPNASELIMNYGAGIGGVRRLRARKFQPSLPISIMDDVDNILTRNRNENVNDTFDYEDSDQENDLLGTISPQKTDALLKGEMKDDMKSFKGDELFKEMKPPLTLVHKDWGTDEIESNPW